jgi:hypothetical protein
VTITVSDSGDGNANVEIFSAAGGGAGIANFPVSANSESTVTANALNFVNSSSVLVSVATGVTGNANISFTALGAAANLEIKDEGSSVTGAVTSIDFVGPGVTATASGSDVTVTISGGGGGSNTIIGSDLFTAANADANLTYTLSEAVPGTNYVFVSKNGISLIPGVDYIVEPDYQTLRVIEAGQTNDAIEVRYFTPLSAVLVPNTTIVIDSNTVVAQTNTFSLTSNVTDITLLTVTKNGLFLTPNSHFALSDNNVVTLTTVAEIGDELVFRYFRDQGIDEVSNNSVSSVFTANGVSNTYFMNSFALDANNILVTIDGIVLTPGVEYEVSGPVLTIAYTPGANSIIETRTITGGGDGSVATLGFYRNSYVGDGNTVNFTLDQTPYDEDNCLVFVDRILQRNSEYNVSATTLTFTGAPDANSVIDVFVTNYLATNKALIKTGDTMTGNLNVAATLITQNVIPDANVTYDLGSNTKRFKDLWLSNSTIYLGEASISANGNALVVPAIETDSGVNLEAEIATVYSQANAAFNAANNRVLKAGDTMTGVLNVANTLLVTGNIGIGLTNPASKLHILDSGSTTNSGVIGLRLFYSSSGTPATGLGSLIGFYTPNSNAPAGAQTRVEIGGIAESVTNNAEKTAFIVTTPLTAGSGTNAERFRITSDGNFGLGTSFPVSTNLNGAVTIYKTHNSDSASIPSTTAQSYDLNQSALYLFGRNSGITIVSEYDEGGNIFFADNDRRNSGAIDYLHTTDTLAFSSNGSSRMVINSIGNVGIGTASPSTHSRLHVYGITGAITSPGLLYSQNLDDASALYISNNGNTGQYDRAVFEVYTANGSTNLFKILNGGAISTPRNPAFSASRTTGFTLNAGSTVIVYDDEQGDRTSNYNNSNGRFTAPVTGYYFFRAHVQPTSAGVSVSINFQKNGSLISYSSVGTTNLYARGDIGNDIVVPLNTNDYIEVVVTVNTTCGFDNHGTFGGYLIG